VSHLDQRHPPLQAQAHGIALRSRACGIAWVCAPTVLERDWLRWCEEVLDINERKRAADLAFERLAVLYRANRGALRRVLSEFTGSTAAALEIKRSPGGKPYLANAACAFNFSDSERHWAVCMQRGNDVELGIDIEETRRFEHVGNGLRAALLSEDEQAAWDAAPPESAAAALAVVWTRKEALLKAIGCGLARPMRSFTAGWLPGPAPLCLPDLDGKRRLWHLHDLPSLPDGLAGCVAVNAD
jgi:4'-phosphopantetheinyl transferase